MLSTLNAESRRHGERNDCSVRAYAAATGTDYATAHYIVAELAQRPARKGPKWGPYLHAFGAMGYTLTRLDAHARGTVALARELPRGRYIVSTSGGRHVAALVDGLYADHCAGRRFHVSNVWRVE